MADNEPSTPDVPAAALAASDTKRISRQLTVESGLTALTKPQGSNSMRRENSHHGNSPPTPAGVISSPVVPSGSAGGNSPGDRKPSSGPMWTPPGSVGPPAPLPLQLERVEPLPLPGGAPGAGSKVGTSWKEASAKAGERRPSLGLPISQASGGPGVHRQGSVGTPAASPTGSRCSRHPSSFAWSGAQYSTASPAWSTRGPKTPAKPIWEEDAKVLECGGCREAFTMTKRKHHCRRCGRCVCGKCSNERRILPFHQGRSPTASSNAERVCDACVVILDKASAGENGDLGGGPLTELMLRRGAREHNAQLPQGEGWAEASCPEGHGMILEVGGIPSKEKSERPERFECKRCREWLRAAYRCSDCRYNACRSCYLVLRWRLGIPIGAIAQFSSDESDIGDDPAASISTENESASSPGAAASAGGVSVEWMPQQTPDFFPCAMPLPPWVPDSVSDLCAVCESLFSLTRRRHHCRGCGRCICGACSRARHALPELGQLEQVRLCADCAGVAQMGGFDL
eukprot:Hpha_TRINITY_DN7429_c0_g1::TRINITY_DN7429_c0_g1_i1::g.95882::m.95882